MPTLLALLALGVLVLVHELGHLAVARAVGARAVVFSIGLGLPLYGFRTGGQRWVLGAIPWGGWLRLEGENPYQPAPSAEAERTFAELSPLRRALVFLAGPLVSLLLGLLLLWGLHMAGTHLPVPMRVGTVAAGSEAARAGLRPGDVLVSVDGTPLPTWSALTHELGARAGRAATLTVRRGEGSLSMVVVPQIAPGGRGHLGITEAYAFARQAPGPALGAALAHARVCLGECWGWAVALVRGPEEAGGPGAAALLLRRIAAVESWDALVRALAAASLALGLVYLLPLPALDGGRLLLTGWEALRGRPVDARVQTALQLLSLLLAILAVGVLAFHEVRHALAAARGSG